MRNALVERTTGETQVSVRIDIDGTGQSDIQTGIGFFDHMLTLFARHGLFDTVVKAAGDIQVDGHHTVEDTGIVLGQALAKALGSKAGIRRYGTAFTPMDEALAMVSIDISGRPYLVFDAIFPTAAAGGFDSELVEEFMRALVTNAGITLHIKMLAGKNTHHMIEAIFKALGRALDKATRLDDRISGVLSTKGTL